MIGNRGAAARHPPRLAVLGAFIGCVLPVVAGAQAFDPAGSRFGFELHSRWGEVITGDFPRFEGAVEQLPDGRHRVRLRLDSASVEVPGSARYTRFARSAGFLDAKHHPWVEFRSEPFPADLVQRGGTVRGTLSLRGVSRAEALVVDPARCARPGRDCDALAQGIIRRTDYGMVSWRWALRDEVRFTLRVRVQDAAP